MAQRRHHYERAFEHYLRAARIPYVAVDEAKKALLPPGAKLELTPAPGAPPGTKPHALKSLDFVVYGDAGNLLLEVKGRKVPAATLRRDGTPGKGRFECWVTLDDVESMIAWRRLFGPEFDAVFVFIYWCLDQPPDGLFHEVIEFEGRWYATRAIDLDSYMLAMKTRSPKWRTVHLPSADFERLSRPFAPPGCTVHDEPRGWTPGVIPDAGPVEPAFEPMG